MCAIGLGYSARIAKSKQEQMPVAAFELDVEIGSEFVDACDRHTPIRSARRPHEKCSIPIFRGRYQMDPYAFLGCGEGIFRQHARRAVRTPEFIREPIFRDAR